MAFQNSVVGGTTLVRPAITSPNYVAGNSGWRVSQNGSAEFNDLALRGVFTGTNYVLKDKGLFFYSGTPAAGNMTGSWAAVAGTDDWGNVYPAGLQIVSPFGSLLLDPSDGFLQSVGSSGAIINVGDGQITFNQPGQAGQGVMIQNLRRTHGSLYLAGGKAAGADEKAQLGIITSYGTPTAGNADTFPRTSSTAYSGSTVAHHYVSGAVVKSDALGDTAETWQSPAYNTNWGPSTTFNSVAGWQALQFRRDAMDNLIINGCFKSAATAGGVAVMTLPTAYRPKVNGIVQITRNSGGTLAVGNARVTASNGNLDLLSGLGITSLANAEYLVTGTIPLGNIA